MAYNKMDTSQYRKEEVNYKTITPFQYVPSNNLRDDFYGIVEKYKTIKRSSYPLRDVKKEFKDLFERYKIPEFQFDLIENELSISFLVIREIDVLVLQGMLGLTSERIKNKLQIELFKSYD